jgi:hypothetical protein
MPLVAVSDGVSERFDIGLARFTEFAQHFQGPRLSQRFRSRREWALQRSIDIDPSLELIVDGYVDEAERTRIDDELTAREMERRRQSRSDNTTAVAVSIVVVLLLHDWRRRTRLLAAPQRAPETAHGARWSAMIVRFCV